MNLFIFRRDFRIFDNLSLNKLRGDTLFIFIFNPKQIYKKNNKYFSNNSVQFMIESLEDLEKHIHINYYIGDDLKIINSLHKKYNFKNIAFNLDYTPFARKRDALIIEYSKNNNIHIITEEDYTLFSINSIKNEQGNPYKVFTPFYRKTLKLKPSVPTNHKEIKDVVDIKHFNKKRFYIHNDKLAVNGGRINALNILKKGLKNYLKTRDYPALDSTTKLSGYIKYGCVSIREVFYNYDSSLRRELIWREFYANILYHFPYVLGNPFRDIPIKWENNKEYFRKWCEGKTGFPLIDAGMKQLNETGYMHNRVRMLAATFLVKDLLVDWRYGERYFASKLLDYDPASNNGGWQWCASTGTDSQPYFRIFNPYTQLKKFDKNYDYVKRWNPDIVPEIIDHSERSRIFLNFFVKKI